MSGFFITGTDTGVGKTFVTAALILALQQRGLAVAPMKPLAAGTIDVNGVPINDDVALLCDLSDHHYPLHAVNPYCFREAIAPHIAAQNEKVDVDISVIQTAYLELATRADVVLVEGAGGFLVPMSASESMALIPAALHLPVILVVGMRLGCINHALLTVEAIRARGLALAGWVANTCGETMNAYAENLSTLKSLIPAPLIGEIAHITTADEFDAAAEAAEMLNIQPLIQPEEPS
ncbi:MAG: dethiobiotin synthase [Betaproteobacteria bacterium]|nr:dethiobiotin synthase [Betaproteobacteria bacterium]